MGYVAARERLLRVLAAGKAVSTIVYGGDSHNAWAGMLTDAAGKPVAVEFDGMSVSSGGYEVNFPWLPPDMHAEAWRAANPDLLWGDVSRRGYMLVNLNKTMQHIQYLAVNVTAESSGATELLAEFVRRSQAGRRARLSPPLEQAARGAEPGKGWAASDASAAPRVSGGGGVHAFAPACA
eukprot:CAMPEP_0171156470 /NCGR_PEP_ID=MMETSP0790-20130122/1454_1 /TAXON_ID=2925 /ORGANISM="Alexandrium catenella, Strain OF101" /LENGTH=179 /DNA_ID=CAMNT_0011620765 /DNA_START=1 /DNA_END=537 /DNA_ORIENTATION=-